MSRPAAQKPRSVFAPATALSFKSNQADECREFLNRRSADTEIVPIVDENQLIMAADGRILENGYRFNAIGFAALSTAMVGGLNNVFNELSGESRYRFHASLENGDLAAAVGIYNTCLHARFEALRERTLLINHREKTIEGFLGLEHKYLDNALFFNTIAEEAANRQTPGTFYRAELLGRELRLFFIDESTRRDSIHPDPRHIFASGWYFSNREDTGFAMRSTLCLLTRFGAAIEPRSATSQMRHTGADLVGRAVIMIGKTMTRTLDMDDVSKNVQRLLSTPLNFSESKLNFDNSMAQWVNFLTRLKICRDDARQICKNAALAGSDVDPRNPLDLYTKEVVGSRSLYDLFCSMLRHSRRQYHTTRDLVQGAALQLLLPTTK